LIKRSPRPPSRKRGPPSKGRGGKGGRGREGKRGREGRGGILPDQSKYGCYGPANVTIRLALYIYSILQFNLS